MLFGAPWEAETRAWHTGESIEAAQDAKTFEFEGKPYTVNDAKKMQAELENRIKHYKDRSVIANAAGDTEERTRAQEKINILTDKYVSFSEASGLPTRMERIRVAGYRKVKTVDNFIENSIMESVYDAAVNGEKHSGIYKDALSKTKHQLKKSIKSHEAQVEEHKNKINNPSKYDKGWDSKTQQEKDGLIKKWKKDLKRNAEQAEIERRVSNERFEK